MNLIIGSHVSYKKNDQLVGSVKEAISYNANNGTGAPSNQIKTQNVNLILSDTIPTRSGYKFMGWNINSNGSGTSYASGSSYTARIHPPWEAVYPPDSCRPSTHSRTGEARRYWFCG